MRYDASEGLEIIRLFARSVIRNLGDGDVHLEIWKRASGQWDCLCVSAK